MVWVGIWLLLALGAIVLLFLLVRDLWRKAWALLGEITAAADRLSVAADRLSVTDRPETDIFRGPARAAPGAVRSRRRSPRP